MTPTWLEIAVAIVLLWVAWRLALLLTPIVLNRIRGWRRPPSQSSNKPDTGHPPFVLRNVKNKDHEP